MVLGAAVTLLAVDPATASIVVAAIGAMAALGAALVTAKYGAERVSLNDKVRRYERYIERKGDDPDDV